MVQTPGICTRTISCDTARSGRSLTIPLGTAFVCPECGASLVPPTQESLAAAPPMPLAVPLSLVGAGLLVLGGAVFLGHELGAGLAVPPAPPRVASLAPASLPSPAAPQAAIPARSDAEPPAPAPLPTPPKPAVPATAATSPAALPAALPTIVTAAATPALPPVPAAPAVVASPKAASTPPPEPPIGKAAPAPSIAVIPPTPSMATTPPAPQMAAVAPAAPTSAKPQPPQPPLPEVAAISDQPFSPVPVAGGAPGYPAELTADGRVGRVNVTCLIQADGIAANCHATAGKGGAAFVAPILAWLAHGRVRFHPIVLHGHPAAMARTWPVTLDEPAGVLAEARRQHAAELAQATAAKAAAAEAGAAAPSDVAAAASPEPAPMLRPARPLSVQPVAARQLVLPAESAPTVPDQPFSTRVVSGGAPAFPASYDQNRPGAVTVSCLIGADGAASDCQTVKARGGAAFGWAVKSWLGTGRVRFRPMTFHGQAVSQRKSWTIVFNHMPEND